MKKLTQDVFKGLPGRIRVACVDHDGLMKFGNGLDVRLSDEPKRWEGARWLKTVRDSGYEPLSCLIRENKRVAVLYPLPAERWRR